MKAESLSESMPSDLRPYTGLRPPTGPLPTYPVTSGRAKSWPRGMPLRSSPSATGLCRAGAQCAEGAITAYAAPTISAKTSNVERCEMAFPSMASLRQEPCSKSDGVSYQEACFCEPVACCINGSLDSDIQFCDNVVIIGAGPKKPVERSVRSPVHIIFGYSTHNLRGGFFNSEWRGVWRPHGLGIGVTVWSVAGAGCGGCSPPLWVVGEIGLEPTNLTDVSLDDRVGCWRSQGIDP
jgi:hypothetical protein